MALHTYKIGDPDYSAKMNDDVAELESFLGGVPRDGAQWALVAAFANLLNGVFSDAFGQAATLIGANSFQPSSTWGHRIVTFAAGAAWVPAVQRIVVRQASQTVDFSHLAYGAYFLTLDANGTPQITGDPRQAFFAFSCNAGGVTECTVVADIYLTAADQPGSQLFALCTGHADEVGIAMDHVARQMAGSDRLAVNPPMFLQQGNVVFWLLSSGSRNYSGCIVRVGNWSDETACFGFGSWFTQDNYNLWVANGPGYLGLPDLVATWAAMLYAGTQRVPPAFYLNPQMDLTVDALPSGVLLDDLPASDDPDYVYSVRVDLSESCGSLQTSASEGAQAGNLLAIANDGDPAWELVRYATAEVVDRSTFIYRLTGTLQRGASGALLPQGHPSAVLHPAGSRFFYCREADHNPENSAPWANFIGLTMGYLGPSQFAATGEFRAPRAVFWPYDNRGRFGELLEQPLVTMPARRPLSTLGAGVTLHWAVAGNPKVKLPISSYTPAVYAYSPDLGNGAWTLALVPRIFPVATPGSPTTYYVYLYSPLGLQDSWLTQIAPATGGEGDSIVTPAAGAEGAGYAVGDTGRLVKSFTWPEDEPAWYQITAVDDAGRVVSLKITAGGNGYYVTLLQQPIWTPYSGWMQRSGNPLRAVKDGGQPGSGAGLWVDVSWLGYGDPSDMVNAITPPTLGRPVALTSPDYDGNNEYIPLGSITMLPGGGGVGVKQSWDPDNWGTNVLFQYSIDQIAVVGSTDYYSQCYVYEE